MVSNALAGAAVGYTLGLTPEEIKAGIENYTTIPGRNHLIQTDSLTILDDCYNANPVSTKAALDVLALSDGRKVAVLGDMGELGEKELDLHYQVGAYAAAKGIDLVCGIGPMAESLDPRRERRRDLHRRPVVPHQGGFPCRHGRL